MNDPDYDAIIARIKQLQIQNGLRAVSPMGQDYIPMDQSPAPPGYRLNQMPRFEMLAAMLPKKPGFQNPTEGAPTMRGGGGGRLDSKFVGASRGGNSINPLEAAAREYQAASANIGPERALQAVARRWEIDPAALKAFLSNK